MFNATPMKVTTYVLTAFLLISISDLSAQDPKRFEDFVQSLMAKDAVSPPDSGIVLFVGSSSIRRWEGLAAAFPNHSVLNRGFGGSQFSDLIYYADQLIFSYQPARILVYEGDNDINAGKSTRVVLRDAKRLVKMIQRKMPGVPIAFICPKPSISRWHLKDQYLQTNAALKAFADRKSGLDYLDIWYPSLGEDGKPRPETFVEDQLHMNEKGYVVWKEVIGAYLDKE